MGTPPIDAPPAVPAATPAGLNFMRGTAADLGVIESWAGGEGWSLGRGDGQLFARHHPDGILMGILDDQPVSAIWIANHTPDFPFAGALTVQPGFRGRGIGAATWEVAAAEAAGRAVSVESAPGLRDFFAQRGFYTQWRTIGYIGPIPPHRPTADPNVVPLLPEMTALAAVLDARCFPADRPAMAAAWATAPQRHALAYIAGGRMLGYGVVRPAWRAARIGPLYAAEPYVAAALFDALAAHAGGNGALAVSVDVPEPNRAAMALTETRGLSHVSETHRMTSPGGRMAPREPDRALLWALTSREVG